MLLTLREVYIVVLSIRLSLWRVHSKETVRQHLCSGTKHYHHIQLVIDRNINALPRRKTDNAIIVRSKDTEQSKARVFKLNANPSDPVLLER